MEDKPTELLFSYGTLQDEAVQLKTFGRKLNGERDRLVGYSLRIVEVEDQTFAAINGSQQRNAQYTGAASDFVEGIVLTLTKQELERGDAYEPQDYNRVQVKLKSGLSAWVYVCTHN